MMPTATGHAKCGLSMMDGVDKTTDKHTYEAGWSGFKRGHGKSEEGSEKITKATRSTR